jgi:hypothetical protein
LKMKRNTLNFFTDLINAFSNEYNIFTSCKVPAQCVNNPMWCVCVCNFWILLCVGRLCRFYRYVYFSTDWLHEVQTSLTALHSAASANWHEPNRDMFVYFTVVTTNCNYVVYKTHQLRNKKLLVYCKLYGIDTIVQEICSKCE